MVVRQKYADQLLAHKDEGLVKVVTGVMRCSVDGGHRVRRVRTCWRSYGKMECGVRTSSMPGRPPS